MESDELLPVAESLQMFRLAEIEGGDIKLTDIGKQFVEMATDDRKKLFARQLLAQVPLAAHIRRVLQERANHVAPKSRFLDELEDHMSTEDAEHTLRAVIAWGRFAEVFAYDDDSETLQPRKSDLRSVRRRRVYVPLRPLQPAILDYYRADADLELSRPGLRAARALGISRLRGFLAENPGSAACGAGSFSKAALEKARATMSVLPQDRRRRTCALAVAGLVGAELVFCRRGRRGGLSATRARCR